MRLPLVSRALVPPALCAAIVFAAAGPAAATTSVPEPAPAAAASSAAAAEAPIPGAPALTQKVDALRRMDGVPTAVTDLLDDVLKADGGQLSPARAAEHAAAVKTALASAKKAPSSRAVRADVVDDTLAALQKAIDELIKAATSGAPLNVVTSVLDVVTGLIGSVVSGILGALPVDLPSLPVTLPTLPIELPVTLPGLPPVSDTSGTTQTPTVPATPVEPGDQTVTDLFDFPDITIPDVNIPDINIPDVYGIPDINIPDVYGVPDTSVPDIYGVPEVP